MRNEATESRPGQPQPALFTASWLQLVTAIRFHEETVAGTTRWAIFVCGPFVACLSTRPSTCRSFTESLTRCVQSQVSRDAVQHSDPWTCVSYKALPPPSPISAKTNSLSPTDKWYSQSCDNDLQNKAYSSFVTDKSFQSSKQ